MLHHLTDLRRRVRQVFFGPPYHEADHAALTPRGNQRGIRAVLAVVGLIWGVVILGDGLARLRQPGPKSWRFLQGARILSEPANQPRHPWPLHAIMATRLNVASLNAPYVAMEDQTPRWVTTDAYGFRKSTSTLPYEVVLCGDSFFVNDVIADSLARHLGRSVGNAAIDGRGTLTMARLLDEPAPNFRHPKQVVWLRTESGINTFEFATSFDQRRAELRPVGNPVRRLYAAWHETILWPANLDGYLSESSPIRPTLVHWNSEVDWNLWQKKDTTVLLGTRQLPAGVAPMQFLADEHGLLPTPMSTADLTTVADRIAKVQQELAARGIAFAFAAAPDKSTIYPDRIPQGLVYHGGFIKRLYAELRARNVTVIDLETPLRLEAERNPLVPLFYTTDTHWNPRGQALAARMLAAGLQQQESQLVKAAAVSRR